MDLIARSVAQRLHDALGAMRQEANAPYEVLSVVRPLLGGTSMAAWFNADPGPTIRVVRVACGQVLAGNGLAASLGQLGADVVAYEDAPCPLLIVARAEFLLSGVPEHGAAEGLRRRLRDPSMAIPGLIPSLHEVASLAVAAAALVRDDEARYRS